MITNKTIAFTINYYAIYNINRKGRIDGGGGLKHYDRKKFEKMSEEEKEGFLSKISDELRYRMAEGNPHQTEESKVEVTLPKPLLPDVEDDSTTNNSDEQTPKA